MEPAHKTIPGMKKEYIRPQMAVMAVGTCAILAGSGPETPTEDFDFVNGDNNIDGEEEAG